MDVLYFLKVRTMFIQRFYAGEPFRATIRKIEAGEAPFDAPTYSEDEDGETPFEEEWSEANTALEMLGRTCISMLSASLQLYFKTWEREIGITWQPGERKKACENGFVQGYRRCFGDALKLAWEDCPVNFDILEQVVLARNSDQHPEHIATLRVIHTQKHQRIYQPLFFISDTEKKMIADRDMAGISWMRPTVHISPEALVAAVKEVEALGEWMEKRMIAAK